MKKILFAILLSCVFQFVFICDISAGTFKPESYKAVESKVLKLKPEDYRNKKIFYEGMYSSTQTTFPPYAEKNGIKAGKYFWLIISPANMPVVARKGKDLDDAIIALKRGSTVKVYGKVKKFKYKPELTILPPYYLELVHIEVTKEPEKELPDNAENKRDKFRKRWKDKREHNWRIPPPQAPK